MAEKDVSTADPVTTAGEVVNTANVVVSTAEVTIDNTTTTTVDELTLAQTLIEIKATKSKARGAKDKGKAKMVELEKPLKKKDQIMFDKEMLFDKEMQRVNTFVDMDAELVKGSETRTEGSSKRAGEELESENLKKQKLDENVEAEVDDDQEEAEMKKHMEIVPDDEVAIDAIPLATKPPIIVDWKIIKEGKMGYFQIIRADGSSKRYSSMIQMLQNIDREDLETLWKLVKAKHGSTRVQVEKRDIHLHLQQSSAKIKYRYLKSSNWSVRGILKNELYQVQDNQGIHTVNLQKGECTCRRWQISGLPCGHVCAVAIVEGLTSVNNLAKPWFLIKTIKATYARLFLPVTDVSTWEIPNEIQQVLPLDMGKKQSGRPKNRDRIRSQGEGPIINKCGRCGVKGHNRTFT
ncbi:uncharacterized mitochondrial protein-like protein [Tanacetum coccineum]|uniref:Uncharacterized mitochondrial protein-like protein n=1 Tax=Tanacetum coccineum TaxID=301880 RepID=A0ABQ4ZEQ4_9ASTR